METHTDREKHKVARIAAITAALGGAGLYAGLRGGVGASRAIVRVGRKPIDPKSVLKEGQIIFRKAKDPFLGPIDHYGIVNKEGLVSNYGKSKVMFGPKHVRQQTVEDFTKGEKLYLGPKGAKADEITSKPYRCVGRTCQTTAHGAAGIGLPPWEQQDAMAVIGGLGGGVAGVAGGLEVNDKISNRKTKKLSNRDERNMILLGAEEDKADVRKLTRTAREYRDRSAILGGIAGLAGFGGGALSLIHRAKKTAIGGMIAAGAIGTAGVQQHIRALRTARQADGLEDRKMSAREERNLILFGDDDDLKRLKDGALGTALIGSAGLVGANALQKPLVGVIYNTDGKTKGHIAQADAVQEILKKEGIESKRYQPYPSWIHEKKRLGYGSPDHRRLPVTPHALVDVGYMLPKVPTAAYVGWSPDYKGPKDAPKPVIPEKVNSRPRAKKLTIGIYGGGAGINVPEKLRSIAADPDLIRRVDAIHAYAGGRNVEQSQAAIASLPEELRKKIRIHGSMSSKAIKNATAVHGINVGNAGLSTVHEIGTSARPGMIWQVGKRLHYGITKMVEVPHFKHNEDWARAQGMKTAAGGKRGTSKIHSMLNDMASSEASQLKTAESLVAKGQVAREQFIRKVKSAIVGTKLTRGALAVGGLGTGGHLIHKAMKKKPTEQQLAAREELNVILFGGDPRPRNPLGMFSGSDGGPNPQSMAITYQFPMPPQQPPPQEEIPTEQKQQPKQKKIMKRDTQLSAREELNSIIEFAATRRGAYARTILGHENKILKRAIATKTPAGEYGDSTRIADMVRDLRSKEVSVKRELLRPKQSARLASMSPTERIEEIENQKHQIRLLTGRGY